MGGCLVETSTQDSHRADTDAGEGRTSQVYGGQLLVEADGKPVVYYELSAEGSVVVDIQELSAAKLAGGEKRPPPYAATPLPTESVRAGMELHAKS
jgi:hypothetical protein